MILVLYCMLIVCVAVKPKWSRQCVLTELSDAILQNWIVEEAIITGLIVQDPSTSSYYYYRSAAAYTGWSLQSIFQSSEWNEQSFYEVNEVNAWTFPLHKRYLVQEF